VKHQLAKFKPTDYTKEPWETLWERQGPLLEPLALAIKDLKAPMTKIKASDFETPNHYAKMVYEEARKQAFQEVLEMLPKSIQ